MFDFFGAPRHWSWDAKVSNPVVLYSLIVVVLLIGACVSVFVLSCTPAEGSMYTPIRSMSENMDNTPSKDVERLLQEARIGLGSVKYKPSKEQKDIFLRTISSKEPGYLELLRVFSGYEEYEKLCSSINSRDTSACVYLLYKYTKGTVFDISEEWASEVIKHRPTGNERDDLEVAARIVVSREYSSNLQVVETRLDLVLTYLLGTIEDRQVIDNILSTWSINIGSLIGHSPLGLELQYKHAVSRCLYAEATGDPKFSQLIFLDIPDTFSVSLSREAKTLADYAEKKCGKKEKQVRPLTGYRWVFK
jgi:hypothetical protein